MSSSFKSYVHGFGLHNFLGLVCICVILASFFYPWWEVTVHGEYRPWTIEVYPQGAYGELPVGTTRSLTDPRWFIALTAVLLVCIILSFLGSTLKGKKGNVLLGVAGAVVLGIWRIFYLRILERCRLAGIPVEGTFLEEGGFILYQCETAFQLGYRILFWAGVLCIASAVFLFVYDKLRRKSLRKPPPIATGSVGALTFLLCILTN